MTGSQKTMSIENQWKNHPAYEEDNLEIKTPKELKEAKKMAGITKHEDAERRQKLFEGKGTKRELFESELDKRIEKMKNSGLENCPSSAGIFDLIRNSKEIITPEDFKKIAYGFYPVLDRTPWRPVDESCEKIMQQIFKEFGVENIFSEAKEDHNKIRLYRMEEYKKDPKKMQEKLKKIREE